MSSLINTTIKPFKATAFHQRRVRAGHDADVKGSGRSSSSTRPTSPSFARPSSATSADLYAQFQKLGVEIYSVSTDTHFTHKAWHDASETIKKIEYRWSATPPTRSAQLRRPDRRRGPGAAPAPSS